MKRSPTTLSAAVWPKNALPLPTNERMTELRNSYAGSADEIESIGEELDRRRQRGNRDCLRTIQSSADAPAAASFVRHVGSDEGHLVATANRHGQNRIEHRCRNRHPCMQRPVGPSPCSEASNFPAFSVAAGPPPRPRGPVDRSSVKAHPCSPRRGRTRLHGREKFSVAKKIARHARSVLDVICSGRSDRQKPSSSIPANHNGRFHRQPQSGMSLMKFARRTPRPIPRLCGK